MQFHRFAARFALALSLCLMTAVPAQAKYWQCVTFAREVSGIDIHGNARTWWSQADGRYVRGDMPEAGAVMSFAPIARMPLGHVAMVSKVVNDREVLLTHANWSVRGGVEHDVRAVDVSDAGDWSEVKVWYGPIGALGSTTYPVNGFIYPDAGPDADDLPGGDALPLPMAKSDLAQRGIVTLVN
ncbi:CHAP domain-containing protein [Stakelama saccharophila]|uniref:CHAP domain-containing protein n=1 Tax=Stakelama saccharophila TaxID=3075605 RepID=A0ABZ0BCQ6_9SPHN|nr:CHAP domain-containing protein [Stakelama sp. W311]WNO54461.1 CHAP domain-containing protein [Stakelama sp. W311]